MSPPPIPIIPTSMNAELLMEPAGVLNEKGIQS